MSRSHAPNPNAVFPSASPAAPRARARTRQHLAAAGICTLAGFIIVIAVMRLLAGPPAVEFVELQTAAAAGAQSGPAGPAGQPVQRIPGHLRRIGAMKSPTAAITGGGPGVDVDIAVLDTGIDATHPDLTVAGGATCTGGNTFNDTDGHGTGVAGAAAARDNGIGTVGAAPGARLWAVKVTESPDEVRDARLVCGLNWVATHADAIDVAVVSIGGYVDELASDCDAGGRAGDVKAALCEVHAAGVTVVASAGNDSSEADTYEPAAHGEAVSVGAFTDTDGYAGGLGGAPSCGAPELDDTFATYSNYGATVDLLAPGTCVRTTALQRDYVVESGTSYSAPVVAGAAALIRAKDPSASPEDVRAALLANATDDTIFNSPDPRRPVVSLDGL